VWCAKNCGILCVCRQSRERNRDCHHRGYVECLSFSGLLWKINLTTPKQNIIFITTISLCVTSFAILLRTQFPYFISTGLSPCVGLQFHYERNFDLLSCGQSTQWTPVWWWFWFRLCFRVYLRLGITRLSAHTASSLDGGNKIDICGSVCGLSARWNVHRGSQLQDPWNRFIDRECPLGVYWTHRHRIVWSLESLGLIS